MAERALHIGIDGRELAGQPTGVGRYLAEIVHVWASEAHPKKRFTIFVPTPIDPAIASRVPNVTWVVVPGPSAGTLWEQTRLPAAIRRARIDVFFAAGYTAPVFCPCPFVVAIYDVSYFAHPEWFRPREGFRRRLLTKRAARRARSVITISEFSAGEIVHHLGIDRGRIHLAPPGAPPLDDETPRDREPIVLYVGTLFERRRIPDLVRAFVQVTRDVPRARLILVGASRAARRGAEWVDPATEALAIATSGGVADRVEWRRYVPDEELLALYRRARVFAFLSDYEGFGMTPSEAIAHGVPPVLLDTPVAREVYGAGAWLVPPAPDAIVQALKTLLTDESRHAALVAAGRARLTEFSWSASAATITSALEAAAAPAPS